MKKFLLIIFMLFLCMPAFSKEENKVIQGGIVYTVETARDAAFSGLPQRIDKKEIKPFWYDEKNKENLEAIKQNKELDDRFVMKFSAKFVKGYSVVYKDKPEYVYYYTTGGYLAAIDYDSKASEEKPFPYKVGKYTAFGRLVSVALYISEDEQFCYSPKGKLLSHWIGNIGYNEKGKEIARRESY